ncbi:MAG: VanZ family protein [Myxococcota bacterium]
MSPRAARFALAALLLSIYSTLGVVRGLTNALRDAGLLRLSVGVAFALAGLGVTVLVLRRPELRRPRTIALLGASAGLYALVIWPMHSPEEKLHFIEYGAVAVLAWLSFPALSGGRRFAAAAGFTLAAGWLDEGIQALLPSRYYDLRDVAFNASAGLMALTVFTLVRRLSHTET